MNNLPNGCISVGAAPESWGFDSAHWLDGSYLWKMGDRVMCSFLWTREPGKGAFRRLVDAIEADGLRVAVPTPLGNMPDILFHMGFEKGNEWSDDFGETCEVWQKPVAAPTAGARPG